jgi:MFS family permease
VTAASDTLDPRRTRRAVLAVGLASGLVGFTTTAVSVGTRGMAEDLSLSTVELGWVVNAYLVAAAAFVLIGGRAGDVIGRVRAFDIGLAIFAASSLLGAVAPGFWALVAARLGQGVGAALILPSSIEVIGEYARRGEEGPGFRWRGLAYACSFAIGPLIGGVLTDWSSWRWIFVVGLAITAVSGVLVSPLRNHPGRGSHRPTQDFLGAALAAVLVALVVVLAERLATWELVSWRSAATAAVCVVLAVVIVWHERRTEHPLLHPFILRDHAVLGANVATIGASIGMLSLLYFFNLFAQSAATFDYAAISVLAALAPFFASMLLCALFAHWFGHRVGPRGPVTLGLLLMVAGFGALALISERTTEAQLFVPLAVAGVGAGIANSSLTSVAVLRLPAGRMNEAAGWISLSRFLGSAMALAVGTSTFLSVTAARADGPVAAALGHVAAQQTGGDAFDQAAAALDRDLSGPLLAATSAVTAERFARTMGVTAAVLALITVTSWWLLGPRPDRASAERVGIGRR